MGGLQLPEPHAVLGLEMEDGAPIRVRRHGNVAGTRLVLSHGNGFAIDAYLPFWGALAERFEIVLFDFRNHGRNPVHGAKGHTYPQFVRDLDRVVRAAAEAFGERPTVGVFHSMSALAALKHAREVRWAWDALVLFDPPVAPPEGHPLRRKFVAFEQRLRAYAGRRQTIFGDPEEMAAQFAATRGFDRLAPETRALLARTLLRRENGAGPWRLACPPELEALVYGANLGLKLWFGPERLAGPAMIIGADAHHPEVMPAAEASRALAEAFPWRYAAIADTGHMLQLERPDACIAAMLEFFRDIGLAH